MPTQVCDLSFPFSIFGRRETPTFSVMPKGAPTEMKPDRSFEVGWTKRPETGEWVLRLWAKKGKPKLRVGDTLVVAVPEYENTDKPLPGAKVKKLTARKVEKSKRNRQLVGERIIQVAVVEVEGKLAFAMSLDRSKQEREADA